MYCLISLSQLLSHFAEHPLNQNRDPPKDPFIISSRIILPFRIHPFRRQPNTAPTSATAMNMNHKENPKNFLHYWWFRYTMATELYIVEKWEQATIHVILALVFAGLWYINATYLLGFVNSLMAANPVGAAVHQYPPVTSSLIVDNISPGGISS